MTVFRFMASERADLPVRMMCRTLGVSPSGFYAWLRREPSARSIEDAELTERIRAIHGASRHTYGAPRVHAALARADIHVGRKRVARLMAAAGLVGVHRRRTTFRTMRDRGATPAPDLVARDFHPSGPDRLWVADITELPTLEGPLYLASVLDAWSRRCVGWSMDPSPSAALVIGALELALGARRPAEGLIHHSDHGTQYTSLAFGEHLRAAGMLASMGSVGDSYDNAMAESFFASLETELIDRTVWRTREEARRAVFEWIAVFYNRVRLHSSIGYLAPVVFEERYRQGLMAA